MKKYFKITIMMLVAFMLVSVSVSFAGDAPAKVKRYKLNDVIEEFKLPDALTGKEVSFQADIKGKATLTALTFMTTACSACQSEIALLSTLADKYGDDLKVISVIVNLNGASAVASYDERYGYNVRYLLDPDFTVPNSFGFTYTPSLVIINKAGKVIYMKGGYSQATSGDEILDFIKKNL